MWTLDNRTGLGADRNWTRDKSGVHLWIVAVQATFQVGASGKLTPAEEQQPPTLAPVYHGEPGLSSLRRDSDLLAVKPGTDVLVNAHAHAPRGRPTKSVLASLRIDKLEKVLRISGTRTYARRLGVLTLSSPKPFVSRPIVYEWAYGGYDKTHSDPRKHRIDARNPIGKGFAARRQHLHRKPAHAIEYASGDPSRKGPAGFGAIDRAWSPRRELAGTYDDAWAASKKPLLPEDYDDRFGLCSPPDQRPTGFLRGGERIELKCMTQQGSLQFELPRRYFVFRTLFGSRREVHRGKLVTVIIEPEDSQLFMVWQSVLKVKARDTEHLDRTVILEKPYYS